jgi:uncharacterized protein YndB with AHSA1/START domain
MEKNFVAHASVDVAAGRDKVWEALVNPQTIKKYMFGTNVVTDWREGSPIVWKGEWQGKSYEDRGRIQRIRPEQMLEYTHFSPMSGLADTPENYHTVTIELATEGDHTRVSLSQDNNATEQARQHSEKNWEMMLTGLKNLLEK